MSSTLQQSESNTTHSPSQETARQYVNFVFFQMAHEFRRLSPSEKEAIRTEVSAIVRRYQDRMMILTYSTVGLKAGVDFLLWCITYELDDFQNLAAEINRSSAGQYLQVPISFFAMTKHSQYVKEHVHEGQEGRRLRIVRPGEGKYLFIYPFVKTRGWYQLPMSERQRMMNEHIAVGHKYPSVKINTTYSFGLDDQEFVVAFETDSPADFLDLVQELRESEASGHTLRDTPMYTCRRQPMDEILELLG
jgi:chlorite dismutase